MKKLINGLFILAFFVAAPASAVPPYFLSGTNITYGFNSDPATVFQVTSNPALPGYSMKNGHTDNVGSNLFSVYGFFEVGTIDNLDRELNDLEEILDRENLNQDDALDLLDDANGILSRVGDQGYFQGGLTVHIPLLPVMFDAFGGVVAVDANISDMFYGRLLDSPVALNRLTNELETASSLYIKNAQMFELSLLYSRYITELADGDLYAGIRTKLMNADFGKTVLKFEELDDDVVDEVSDSLNGDDSEQSTNFGIDIGVIYALEDMRFGATLLNINEPEFSYQTLGQNCAVKIGAARSSCDAALIFNDRINLQETYVMNRQLKLDFAWQPIDWWKVSASYDMNSINDAVGNELQWFYVGSAFTTFYIPSIRIGLHRNLVGTEKELIALGTTILGVFNLDVAFSRDTVSFDGTDVPTSYMLNIGFELTF